MGGTLIAYLQSIIYPDSRFDQIMTVRRLLLLFPRFVVVLAYGRLFETCLMSRLVCPSLTPDIPHHL